MSDFPRRFGSYLLLKPLARGGMGALYLALSGAEETAKLCVIKTVLPHLADKEYLQRFRDEAKVVVRLSHGNLVPVFDSGQADGEIYLAMDFVEGRDLRATWNRCAKKGIAFPIDVAVHIVKELARGLHYAHSFGSLKLVHRDVSPPNVLLSYSGEVKVTDFGLASSTLKMEKTAPGIIYGKVSYMSPEQARGEPLDGRTDLYAAGIILWELLTGRQLFPSGKNGAAAPNDAPTAEELLQRVRYPEIIPPSKRATRVPAELDRISCKALAPDLAERYQTCEELRRDLATFLAQTSPATDGVRVAKFLTDLYGDEIETERRERESMIETARRSLTAAEPVSPRVVKPSPPAPPPPSVRAAPPPPPLAAAGAAAAAAVAVAKTEKERERPNAKEKDRAGDSLEERREKGTIVTGLTRRPPPADKPGAAKSGDSQPGGDSMSLSTDTDAQSVSVIGTLVGGRYRIRRLCGEGGMGRVYEAEHIEIGKRVALKILHPAYSQTPDLVERLKREARAASKISHPNVVDVTDSGTTPDGSFFFVMEYIEGIELGEMIFREKRLEVPRALVITAQVCRALHAAHQVNVIHRDLKPENVLILSRDGQRDFIKVLDFGIAKSGDADETSNSQGRPSRRLTHPGMTMGTPEYMAPEQATGHPADPRSDVYAVGGILYEMLSGKPPYEGANFMEILNKKANTLPPPLSGVRADVPAELEALITRTLAKNASARPQTMEELEREIQQIATRFFPPRTEQDLAIVAGAGGLAAASLNRMPVVRAPSPFSTSSDPITVDGAGPLILRRLRAWERKRLAMAAGGALALLLGAVVLAATSKHGKDASRAVAMASPPPALVTPPSLLAPPAMLAPPPLLAPPPTDAPPAKPSEDPQEIDKTSGGDDGEGRKTVEPSDSDTEPTTRSNGAGRTARGAGGSAADSRKQLAEANALLRNQHFDDARAIFTRLAKSRRDRGTALTGLAECSFQEKHYEEAVRSATRAADRGGGARARVVLGDAHFRLNQFKEAAKAYEGALKLDPKNPSARSGLALANKRM